MTKELGIYRPRCPQKTPFYQCIADHFEEFVQVYDERYEKQYGFWRPGTFHSLPWIDTRKMALLFRDKVFFMLIREGKIFSPEGSVLSNKKKIPN